ncbi:unnamed protein product [Brassicogethes aeneus]|uniref:Uncharacterized protein n=1 Tax=Brassicogethes aeneus TaxID=1431903 RepID=A0A9P0BFC2_BRAAE|nr:unnamed protein product [Brassicogethes aeneus]
MTPLESSLDSRELWSQIEIGVGTCQTLRCSGVAGFIECVSLTENNWADIESLLEALQPAKISAKKLQSDQLLMTDFYCAWLLCIEKTEEIDSTLAKNIVKCMKTRETKLLDNESFLSSVFLDPLLNGLLDESQQAIAKKNLCAIWYRLNQFTENQTQRESEAESEEIMKKLR